MSLMPDDASRAMMVEILASLASHPIKTAEAFRNAILTNGYFAVNPVLDIDSEEKITPLMHTIRDAVQEGRMIDFGYVPNAVILQESVSSRHLFEANEFEHPYLTWVAVSRWEGGMNAYLIDTLAIREDPIFICELYGVAIPGKPPAILLYDMVGVRPKPGDTLVNPAKFKVPQADADLTARACNSMEPVITFLRMLADASIPIVRHAAPEKLQKARAKAGKVPIPPHHEVQTRDYVSMFQASKQANPGRGGHHASPRAHWRRSHKRALASGKIVSVRPSRVNWREAEEIKRLFYRVPREC